MKTYVDKISKHRECIMCVAILWIVWYHSFFLTNGIINSIRTVGYCGVDIFLFLSGIGIYYSLKKNNDVLKFYKRRLLRLAPSYLPFIIVWFICQVMCKEESIISVMKLTPEFLGNIVMTGWHIGMDYQFNWYIQMLAWLYVFSPIFYVLISRRGGGEANCGKLCNNLNIEYAYYNYGNIQNTDFSIWNVDGRFC